MQVLFLDDSKVNAPTRKGVGGLVSVGGVKIHSSHLRLLEKEIEYICRAEYGFPEGEVFKWSPSRDHWFRDNVTGERRDKFFRSVLRATVRHKAEFIVSVVDQTKRHAVKDVKHHEVDALFLTLERFNQSLKNDEQGMVLLAKPSGGAVDERKLLRAVRQLQKFGTGYVQFDKIALDVVPVPFSYSPILQVADIVVSATTTMVAGLDQHASRIFDDVRVGFLKNASGQIGGYGLKIHPSHLVNLYHWVAGDKAHRKVDRDLPLPNSGYWFGSNPIT